MPSQYHFTELHPIAFQRLINALLVGKYGEGVRLLPLQGSDGGRDAETPEEGTLYTLDVPQRDPSAPSTGIKAGRYLFQVKYHKTTDRTGTATRAAVLQDFAQELNDNVLNRFGGERSVDYFFLITNVPSSKDAHSKVDEKRREIRAVRPTLHADVLWQEHVVAWLDQAPKVWTSYPELFAGGVVPVIGQIATDQSAGLPLALRLAIRSQFLRDSTIRFRQIELVQRLSRLFVDLDARMQDSPHLYYQMHADVQRHLILSESGTFYEQYEQDGSGVLDTLGGEYLRGSSKLILEGGPGQGKSTVTQMLAQIYRSLLVEPGGEYSPYTSRIKRARLPFRIELRLFAEWLGDTDRSLEQYLAELLTSAAGGNTISVSDLHEAATKEDVLLIFDGLDEVGSDSLRDLVVGKIVECVGRFEGAAESDLRVIVTSRPPAVAGRLDALSGFRRVQLQPLSEYRADMYVNRWTDVQCEDESERERVSASFQKRRAEAHVAALIKNPMQLSVLLHFIRLRGEAFPDRRAELYREYFKTVIDRDVEKSPELLRHRKDIEALHEIIGFTIHSRAEGEKSAARLTRSDLISLVRKWFVSEEKKPEQAETLFKIGEERLGLIVALSGEGAATQYGFEIQPVREFFAAAYIDDKCEGNANDLFEQMVRRPFWKEVARFLGGLRRANERADLLARAKQLDAEPEFGWRSDGLAIVYQLVQEGVMTSPGHVHRESLSFLIDVLQPSEEKVRVIPKGLLHDLPRLISDSDSTQPKEKLQKLMIASRGWSDVHDCKKVWSVANRTFSASVLADEVLAFSGDGTLRALVRLLWPAEAEKDFTLTLQQRNGMSSIPRSVLDPALFSAAMQNSGVRRSDLCVQHQQGLIEQFAFRGILDYAAIKLDDTNLGVWQLCLWLERAAGAYKTSSAIPDSAERNLRLDDVEVSLANALRRIIDLLRTIATSSGNHRRQSIKDLSALLDTYSRQDGMIGLLATRCALTLLAYIDGGQRVHFNGHWGWARVHSGGIRRSPLWQTMQRNTMKFFRSAFPSDFDKAGRNISSQLASRGFLVGLQSHLYLNGMFVSFLELLENSDAGKSIPEWLERVPVQQYWLANYLTQENTVSTLKIFGKSPRSWTSPVLELTPNQIGHIASAVRNEDDTNVHTGAIFALQGSKFAARFRKGTLSKMLVGASKQLNGGNYIFQRGMYLGSPTPEVVSETASQIIDGTLKVPSIFSDAAATYLSESRAVSLVPLRALGLLPKSALL